MKVTAKNSFVLGQARVSNPAQRFPRLDFTHRYPELYICKCAHANAATAAYTRASAGPEDMSQQRKIKRNNAASGTGAGPPVGLHAVRRKEPVLGKRARQEHRATCNYTAMEADEGASAAHHLSIRGAHRQPATARQDPPSV